MSSQTQAFFRPDIQGMRAVAVVAVILFHIHPSLLKGGFVGVDIFFVISGFVMGRLVYREVSEQRFSWRGFLFRRIRRIMPALLVMIVAVSALLPFIVGPDRAIGQAKIALAAVFGVSNIPLWISMKYFGPAAETHAFLHTWSLAVEEQFYLLLPLVLLWITAKYPTRLLEFLIAAMALSLAAAHFVLNTTYQTGAFYLIPFRGWELGLGLVTAIAGDRGALESLTTRHRNWLGWSGALAIVASFLLLSQNSLFPGLSALPACIGTCLLLAAGPHAAIPKMLSCSPLIWVGGISYSLYLWHVPCLAITRIITEKELSASSACCAVAATLALGAASYYLIEQPFRSHESKHSKGLKRTLVALAVAAVLIPLSIILSESFAFRYSPEQRKKFTEVSPRAHYRYVVDRFNNLNVHRKPFRENEGPRVLVVGDSFAQDFINVLSEGRFMDTNCVRTLFIPAICQPVPIEATTNRNIPSRDRAVCARRESINKATGVFAQSDLVFLAADWRTWSAELVSQTVSEIRKHGCRKVVVVGTKRIPTITDRMIMRGQFQPADISEVASAREVNAILERNSHAFSFIDLQRLLQKPNGEVSGESDDGVLLSYDGKHLTKAGASFISEKLNILEFAGQWRLE